MAGQQLGSAGRRSSIISCACVCVCVFGREKCNYAHRYKYYSIILICITAMGPQRKQDKYINYLLSGCVYGVVWSIEHAPPTNARPPTDDKCAVCVCVCVCFEYKKVINTGYPHTIIGNAQGGKQLPPPPTMSLFVFINELLLWAVSLRPTDAAHCPRLVVCPYGWWGGRTI